MCVCVCVCVCVCLCVCVCVYVCVCRWGSRLSCSYVSKTVQYLSIQYTMHAMCSVKSYQVHGGWCLPGCTVV